MKNALLASFAAASAALCVDARAEAHRHCVTTLEAHPSVAAQKPDDPKQPCPVAVGWSRQSRPTASRDVRDPGAPTARSLPDSGVRA